MSSDFILWNWIAMDSNNLKSTLRLWLGAVEQQAIIWTIDNQYRMTSLMGNV